MNSCGETPQPFTATEVCRIKQATYSANSQGSYAKAETRYLYHNGDSASARAICTPPKARPPQGARPAVAQVRVTYGSATWRCRHRPHDKPQKPFPEKCGRPAAEAAEGDNGGRRRASHSPI